MIVLCLQVVQFDSLHSPGCMEYVFYSLRTYNLKYMCVWGRGEGGLLSTSMSQYYRCILIYTQRRTSYAKCNQ